MPLDDSDLRGADAVLRAISEGGLLLLSDPKRTNAVEVLTGQYPRGSWWKHPQANRIYALLEEVGEHPDVLLAKLVSGKVTYVHRALWPALLAVASARETWQMEGLSPGAASLLGALDEGPLVPSEAAPISRTATKELEARLLARTESVHTQAGRHETRLESWARWAARMGCTPAASVEESKQVLAAAAARLGPPPAEMPWEAAR
jgi:hypothetical protein